jgi:predicted metal-dependent phosphotriesterase family hydrolase
MSSDRRIPFSGQVMTVCGPVRPGVLDIVDAHSHVWIEAVKDTAPDNPILTERVPILAELKEFRQLGGSAIVDCQPGGCGRDGRQLQQLSRESQVAVIASTGFHRKIYYPPHWWLWDGTVEDLARYFMDEIQLGLEETRDLPEPAMAGLMKCACEAVLGETPQSPLEAVARVAAELGVCVEIHTERGADAEAILNFFLLRGVHPRQLVLCHMDKAPDFGLHRDLAKAGVLLEYDTFFRQKYAPDLHVWPLIEAMISHSFDESIALATDMAEASMWKHIGGGPGMAGFAEGIHARLDEMRLGASSIHQLMGGNIANRLAGLA